MTVGIVGVGGTGSQTFQQLAHLGVGRITVVDDDVVEKSNRSRLVGSRPSDAENKPIPKVLVLQRLGGEINPHLTVVPIRGSVLRRSVALQLRNVDILFCCTDNLRSRALLNRLAFQYFVPLIDMGIDIQPDDEGQVRKIGGRVMVVLPDGPCLSCLSVLNSEILTTEEAGHHHTYVRGVQAPAVISLNGVVTSLAVTEFLKLVHGLRAEDEPRRYQMYDAMEGWVRTYLMQPTGTCPLCMDLKGRGDGLSLPCDAE
jgi:molybdopterin/thiamine biosynthesis adenylyltransferase